MSFKPIDRTTVPGQISEQLVTMLRSGGLKSGDRLPSERDLCEQLQVGRSSVREAMKTLEALGIVQRTTVGTVVCDPQEAMSVDTLLRAGKTEIQEVFETRKLVEIELAGLAAERALPGDIQEIAETMVEAEVTEPAEVYTARDISFHKAIAEAGHNSILASIYEMVSSLLFKTHKYHSLILHNSVVPEEARLTRKKTFDEHEEILHAIEIHDPHGARHAMKKHLDRVEKTLLQRVWRPVEEGKTKTGSPG